MNAQSVAGDLDPLVLQQRRGGVVSLTLNRPAQYNVLSEQMLAALHAALESLAADPSARVVKEMARVVGRVFAELALMA